MIDFTSEFLLYIGLAVILFAIRETCELAHVIFRIN